jgi:hypothetical protein
MTLAHTLGVEANLYAGIVAGIMGLKLVTGGSSKE